jgi:hypothetical protein
MACFSFRRYFAKSPLLISFLLCATIAIAHAYYYFFENVDDSYIAMRYALNWAIDGHLLFNRFDQTNGLVQGYSNPGMLVIYILYYFLGADIMLATKIGGVLAYLACLFMVMDILRQRMGGRWMVLAGLSMAATPILAQHASGGLEALYLGFFLTAGYWFSIKPSLLARYAGVVLFAYAALMRPEGLMLIVALPAYWIYEIYLTRKEHKSPWEQGGPMAVFLLITFTFLAVLYATYGALSANTYAAKTGGNTLQAYLTTDGYAYLLHYLFYNKFNALIACAAILVSAIMLFSGKCSRAVVLNMVCLIPGACLAIIARRDYFPNFRFIAPYLPLFILLCATVFYTLLHETDIRPLYRRLAGTALFVLWVAGALADASVAYVDVTPAYFQPDRANFIIRKSKTHAFYAGYYWTPWIRHADIFATFVNTDGAVLYGNIGYPGMLARDIDIIDLAGLVTREFSGVSSLTGLHWRNETSRLLEKVPPSIVVLNEGMRQDYPYFNDLLAKNFVRMDWLKSPGPGAMDHEELYISKASFAPDGGSLVPLDVVKQRYEKTLTLLPHDYHTNARYLDILYVAQDVRGIKSLLRTMHGRKVLGWNVTRLPDIEKYADAPKSESIPLPVVRVTDTSPSERVVTMDLADQGLVVFRQWNFVITGTPETNAIIKPALCLGTCKQLDSQQVQFDENGQARLTVAFDRYAWFGNTEHPPYLEDNAPNFCAYLGYPDKPSPAHPLITLPRDIMPDAAASLRLEMIAANDKSAPILELVGTH